MDPLELRAVIDVDDWHWWYRGRRRILNAEFDRLGLPMGARILDAGCGSGRTLDELRRYGTIAGVDASGDAVAAARARGHLDVREGRLDALPWGDERFDLVTCLDVIEHVPDERSALGELRRVTAPGGYLLVTVPAYQWLWSEHDVRNGHARRYGRRSLRAALEVAGWKVARVSSFNALLLPPAVVVRLSERRVGGGPGTLRYRRGRTNLDIGSGRFNRFLELPLRLEAAFVRKGGVLPFGLSHLAVARRSDVA